MSITELWNNFKNTKIYVDGIQQEVRDKRIEKRTSQLLAEKFPDMMKTLNPQTEKLS